MIVQTNYVLVERNLSIMSSWKSRIVLSLAPLFLLLKVINLGLDISWKL